jgi:hypothetical protein
MAPCESCPDHCTRCAWDHTKAVAPSGQLVVVRSAAEYGCVHGAAVVVDTARNQPFMQRGETLHPLSSTFGGILAGTRLAQDIQAVAA